MNQLGKCLHLYIGCNTNKGIFIGIRKDILLIQTEKKLIEEYDSQNVGNTLFLYLKQLNDLTDEQSKQLIKRRPCYWETSWVYFYQPWIPVSVILKCRPFWVNKCRFCQGYENA